MIQLIKQAITTAIIASVVMSSYAVERESGQINDLRYGEALFNLYQEHYFSSITNLMVAKARKPIIKQDVDPELLLGGLYLYYGLHQNAGEIFSTLAKDHTSQDIQDRAWFNIGKMRYQGHLYSEAAQVLEKIKDTLSTEREAERQNMLANTYLKQQNFLAAYDALKHLKANQDWQVYAQYNMGIALIKSGQNDEGTALLKQISDLKTDSSELKALRDKTNIALGYAYIRNKQPQQSTVYLEKVRLKGPLSAKALLGIGWAYQQQHKLEQALIPWMELRSWPVVDTAVQESLLAVPYTLEQMGKNQLALHHYSYAIENYKKELESLDSVINAVRGGELLFALKPAMITESTLAPEYQNTLPQSIAVPYLHHLLNSVDFQVTHKNYLDLIYLRENLRKWKGQFSAYYLMLKERRSHYEKQQRTVINDSRLKQVNHLKSKRDELAGKLQQIEQQQDVYGLATEDEKELLSSLNRINSSLKRLGNTDDFSEEKEKYERLQGLLLWDISTDYPARYWKVKNELNQTNKSLEITTANLKSLQQSRENAPHAFAGFSDRIKNSEIKLDALLNKIAHIISSQEKRIENQALISLQQRYHQIENYHIRARYSLARLYDRMTLPAKAETLENTDAKTGSDK